MTYNVFGGTLNLALSIYLQYRVHPCHWDTIEEFSTVIKQP